MRLSARRRALKVRKQKEQQRRALGMASEPAKESREITAVSLAMNK